MAARDVKNSGVGGIVIVVTELTELQRSEERYRGIVETLNGGVLIADEWSNLTFVNPQLCELLHYADSDLLGHSIAEFIIGGNRTYMFEKVEHLAKGHAARFEIAWQQRNGSTIPTEISLRPVFDREKHYRGFTGIVTDATELKQAEFTRDRLARIVETAHDAIYSKDLSGRITFWNPGAEKTYGYTANDIIGRSAEILAPATQKAEIAELTNKVIQGQTVAD